MKHISLIIAVMAFATGHSVAQDKPQPPAWPPAGYSSIDLNLPRLREDQAAATRMLNDAGLAGVAKFVTDKTVGEIQPRPGGGLWAGQATSASGKKITVAMASSRVTCTQNECAWIVFVDNIFKTKVDACDLPGRAAISNTEDKLRICSTIIALN